MSEIINTSHNVLTTSNTETLSQLSTDEIRSLLENLATHQFELEVQNIELIEAKALIDNSLNNFQTLFDQAPVAYVAINDDGIISKANTAFCAMFDSIVNGDVSRRTLIEFIHEDSIVKYRNWINSHLYLHKKPVIRIKTAQEDNQLMQMSAARHILFDGSDTTLITFTNVTELKEMEKQLELTSSVVKVASEGCLITNSEQTIIYTNPAFTEITGYLADEILGQSPDLFKSEKHDASFFTEMWSSITKTGKWQGEIWNKRKSGELYPQWLSITTVYDIHLNPMNYVGLFRDITSRKKLDAIIERQANFDQLTQLPNRYLLTDRLEHALEQSKRHNIELSLLFIDLDNFKEVNDTMGHDIGDELLKQAAHRLKKVVRQSDTIARFGGDEFVILLEDSDCKVAQKIAIKIGNVLAKPFVLNDEDCHMSASIGITQFPDDGQTVVDLFKNADQAMYQAKQSGSNQYVFYTPDLQHEAMQRRQIVNELRSAITLNELELYYQPIISLKTGKIEKIEALIRWNHPENGIVGPDTFIPIAEQSGLILQLGDYIFNNAFTDLSIFSQYDDCLNMAINVSPMQIHHDNQFITKLQHYLDTYPVRASQVSLEITEGVLLQNEQKVERVFNAIHDLGLLLSLDDFGKGFSSLSYLHRYNFDVVKIDRDFVRNIHLRDDSLSLCSAIVGMAKALNISVVAEGVELVEQRELLQQLDVELIQGYLISKPLTKNGIIDFLKRDVIFL
jgi:diguanylate cyclase (GGDEF)-like protein/PAS domain S-box-containing protein